MSGNPILDQYLGPHSERTREADNGSHVEVESYVPMLDLQLPDGNRIALPYATLLKVTLDPSAGLTLHYPGDEVRLKGRRLEKLYKGIAQHRVTSVQAVGSRGDFDDDGKPVVTEIAVQCADG